MYPTKEQILNHHIDIKQAYINTISHWKIFCYLKRWKKSNNQIKLKDLETLLWDLEIHNFLYSPDKTIKLLDVQYGTDYHYDSENHIIVLDSNHPSIISTLHEFAHHLLGPDELEACAWSVNLFKKCFPKKYEKLSWKGHMLKLAK
jgi:hypothetical protein